MRLDRILPWPGPLPAVKKAEEAKPKAQPRVPEADGGVSGVQIQGAAPTQRQPPEDDDPPKDGLNIVV